MSDVSRGPGWWLAANEKWYPPERHPDYVPLQRLLADHPEVLSSRAGPDGKDTPLMLVQQGMGVTATSNGSNRFNVSQLFLDAEGVPVVVTVKRTTDSRIRREAIGALLDYVANAWKHWKVRDLQELVQRSAVQKSTSVAAMIDELHPGLEPDTFWRWVENNLRNGRIRMVFMSDYIPPEMVSVIEFLAEQMSPAEVLGVEVVRVQSEEAPVLVPHRITGPSMAATDKVET